MDNKIELHIAGGGLVIRLNPELDTVCYLSQPRPDIIVWGSRFFQRKTDIYYEEAYTVSALTGILEEPDHA